MRRIKWWSWGIASGAIILLFQIFNGTVRSLPIAQERLKDYGATVHRDVSSYRMVKNNVGLFDQSWDFRDATGAQKDLYRIYVSWLGASTLAAVKGGTR